jgi:hypothetical protein
VNDSPVGGMVEDRRASPSIDMAPEDPKVGGIVLLLISLPLGYLSVRPLLEAERGDLVLLSGKFGTLAVMAFVFGLFWALFPGRATVLFGHRRRVTPLGWIVLCLATGIGFLFNVWLESKLKEYGYVRMRQR